MAMSLSVSILDLASSPGFLEILCMIFFMLGFVVCRRARSKQVFARESLPRADEAQKLLWKTIEAEIYSDNTEAALAMWRATKTHVSTPQETLCLIVQALIEVDPKALVAEVTEHMTAHACDLQNSTIAAAVLEVVAQQGDVHTMQQLWQTMQRRFDLAPTVQVQEVLIGGYASVGDVEKVAECMAQVRRQGHKVTIRAYSLAIKGLLQHDEVDAVLAHMQEMRQQGLVVPPFAVTQTVLTTVARNSANLCKVLDKLENCCVALTSEAVVSLYEHCNRQRDIALAHRAQDVARVSKAPICLAAYDALLSLYASSGDERAKTLFKEMQASSVCISEGFCMRLLEKCGESACTDFAEEISCYAMRSF